MACLQALLVVFSLCLIASVYSEENFDGGDLKDMIGPIVMRPSSFVRVGAPFLLNYTIFTERGENCYFSKVLIDGKTQKLAGKGFLKGQFFDRFTMGFHRSGTKRILEIKNKHEMGLLREDFGKFEIRCNKVNSDSRLSNKTFEIIGDVVPQNVDMMLTLQDGSNVLIEDNQQISMDSDYKEGYTITCRVNDTNSNTIVRLLVGEDEYKGETTVEKSVVRGTTIHERLYEINTTIMVVKNVPITSKYHGSSIRCLGITEQALPGDISTSRISFKPKFNKGVRGTASTERNDSCDIDWKLIRIDVRVEPVLTCDQDLMTYIGQENVQISCDLFAIPFVKNNMIRVLYPIDGESPKKKHLKVRIAPSTTDDERYVLTINKIPNSPKFRLTMTISRIHEQMFREYKFIIKRRDDSPITSSITLIKDPSYKVEGKSGAPSQKSISLLAIVTVCILNMFL